MGPENHSEETGWPEGSTGGRSLSFSTSLQHDSSGLCELQIAAPSARDESRLFDLIGRIDHKVLQGYSLYIEIRGTAYKILYGVYWRSVYSDKQFWGLRCEEIERGMWAEGEADTTRIDLPIRYTEEGWTVEEQSLQFLLSH